MCNNNVSFTSLFRGDREKNFNSKMFLELDKLNTFKYYIDFIEEIKKEITIILFIDNCINNETWNANNSTTEL